MAVTAYEALDGRGRNKNFYDELWGEMRYEGSAFHVLDLRSVQ